MEDVLAVYERPYDQTHPVICLDESPKQLISEVRTQGIDSHGNRYEDYEYKRAGVAELYMIAEPKAGKREVMIGANQTAQQWAQVIAHIAEDLYPQAARITIVEDNLAAHRRAALYEIYPAARARQILDRIEFVATPKHESWLNIAELEFSVLNRVGLADRIATVGELKKQIDAYLKHKNGSSETVKWHFTAKDARIKLHRLYPTFSS